VAISPDGKWLVSGGADKIVKVWDVNSGRELWSLPGHSDWVSSVAISSDGKRLASSSADKTIKIWDLMSGQETLTLRGHESLVLGVTFAPDDLRLVSAGFDGVVGLWDARPWTERLRIESEAKGMIDTVRAHATSRRELIHQLEESRSTAAAIRAAALEMAERWTEDEKSVPRE
jgi:WD40 repeat protein